MCVSLTVKGRAWELGKSEEKKFLPLLFTLYQRLVSSHLAHDVLLIFCTISVGFTIGWIPKL